MPATQHHPEAPVGRAAGTTAKEQVDSCVSSGTAAAPRPAPKGGIEQ